MITPVFAEVSSSLRIVSASLHFIVNRLFVPTNTSFNKCETQWLNVPTKSVQIITNILTTVHYTPLALVLLDFPYFQHFFFTQVLILVHQVLAELDSNAE